MFIIKTDMETIEQKQVLPIGLDEAWSFFSNPANLGKITPASMRFRVLNGPLPEEIYPGMIIIYSVRPVLNLPMKWVTEISQVRSPRYFVDNQKAGPYSFWHHRHFLNPTAGGVEVIDIVDFEVPFGWIGRLLEKWFVMKKVLKIFNYRRDKLNELFREDSGHGQ